MCGIAGFWAPESPPYDPLATLKHQSDALSNRGPDSSGDWWNPDANVGFGHRRLSILDLSEEGAQPMISASGRYVLSYNGEIFNYRELREALEPGTWRGHSDTEVMLAAFERWGIESSLKRFNGQFAMSVWDDETRSLTLARDRIGIKPLYYGWFAGTLIFGSELDAFRPHPRFDGRLSREAVLSLLEVGYVPAPISIYEQAFKLPPGTVLTLRSPSSDVPPKPFWSLADVARSASGHESDVESACDRLDELLRESVRSRLVSDVPVGAFLSGGIDSSLVCGVMQSVSDGPIKTYSIGFEDAAFDEAPYAEKVAAHLGTDHTNLYVSSDDALGVIQKLPALYDEPFADQSQIPTYLVSRLAREEVTVCLSGDGGDELFGGYNRYARVLRRWPKVAQMPAPIRRVAAGASGAVSSLERASIVRAMAGRAPRALNRRVGLGQMGRALAILGSSSLSEFYRRSLSLDSAGFAGPVLRDAVSHRPTLDFDVPDDLDLLGAMTYVDSVSYLPDDILVKVDRATMAVSLEGRVPLLDHRVIEFCWSLSNDLKIRNGDRKWLLKRLLERYVPRSLTDRPKKGFAPPLGGWLRGPLRPWVESLLDEKRIREEGVFDPTAIRSVWRQNLEDQTALPDMLWRVLAFQSWSREFGTVERHSSGSATAA